MSFLFPLFFVGALAVAVPIVLHLWKHDVAPPVAFSDIRFLRRAPVMHRRRRRLRELLLLALRVAALLLLVLAFTRPFLDASGLFSRELTVVVLDRSFSMGAPETFQRARAAAEGAIADAPAGHAVGLVVFDHRAEIAHEVTVDRSAVSASLQNIRPGAGTTRFAVGIGAAAEMFASRPGRIVVVTDLQQSGWEGPADVVVPRNVAVEVANIDTDPMNLVVTSIRATPTGIAARVFNGGTERSTTVSLNHDGQLLMAQETVLSAGSGEVVFDLDLPGSGALQVLVEDPGGVPADDSRYLLLDPPAPAGVGIVTNGGRIGAGAFYLERALLAGEDERQFEVAAIAPSALATRELADLEVVAVIGTQGLDRIGRARLASYVASGGGVMIVAGPTLDPQLVADVLGADVPLTLESVATQAETSFSVVDTRHPVFRVFGGFAGTLGQVRVQHVMRIVETEDARVLARFADGTPALAEYEVDLGRAVAFASDLNNEWNDFPRRPTFLPFVHELVQYLAGERDARRELTMADIPAGLELEPGPATLPENGRRVVVNVDPRESEMTRSGVDTFLSHVHLADPDARDASSSQPAEAAQESAQSYWWYAVLAMVLVLVAEGWLGRTLAS